MMLGDDSLYVGLQYFVALSGFVLVSQSYKELTERNSNIPLIACVFTVGNLLNKI